jgi:hypothetical protein
MIVVQLPRATAQRGSRLRACTRSNSNEEQAILSRASTGQRLPGEGWTDTQVVDYLPTCFDRDTILDILLGFSARHFERRLIGITGRRAVQTFAQAGWTELDAVEPDELKRRRAVLEHDAAVSAGLARGTASDVGLEPLFDELGLAPDTSVVSVPLPISGRVAIILVGSPVRADITDLEVVCQAMGEQLETVIKMAKSDALPPADERVPPFPTPEGRMSEPSETSEAHTEIGSPVPRMPGATKERPQRRTLQSGEFDAPFANDPSKPRLQRPPAASHTQNLEISDAEDNAPRLGGRTADSEADEPSPASNPSATMFGLPAYPTGKKPAEKKPTADANSTMFGIPGTEALFAKRDDSGVSVLPDQGVGDQSSEGKRTLMGGIEASRDLVSKRSEEEEELLYDPSVFKSDAELAAERKLEVDEPTSNPNKMTLRGGFEVSEMAEAYRKHVENSSAEEDDRDPLDDSGAIVLEEVDDPAIARDPEPTPIGSPGVDDDHTGQFGRPGVGVDESAAEPPAAESSPEPSPDAASEDEESPDEPADQASSEPETSGKSNVPKAMILRPARKKRSTPAPRRESDSDASAATSSANIPRGPVDDPKPDDFDETPVDYAAAPIDTGDESISEVSQPPEIAPPSEASQPSPREQSTPSSTVRGVGEVERPPNEHTPADDDRLASAFDQYARSSRGDLYESSSHTAIGGGWAPSEPDEPAKQDEPIDDAWLDYFAPEEEVAPEMLSPQSDPEPRKAQVGPSTIPPEAIERIMDSGPHIVELQENFMMMDSRDKERSFKAAHDVADLGEEAIPVLELMFPGRMFIDRYQYTAETLPPVAEHGPILAALVRIGDPSIYISRKFLDHGVIESRFYAVYLLTALNAAEIVGDLFERLFDRDVQTRTVARRVVSQYRRVDHFDSAILAPLRDELRTGNDDSRIEIASDLLSEYRDPRAIEPLLAILGAYQGRANQALHKSLQRITLKSWSSPYEWRQWWSSAKDQKRETWMVEALNSPSDVIRSMVYEEIQRLPGLDLNYHPDQPAKLRERAQGQLIEWFANQVGKG